MVNVLKPCSQLTVNLAGVHVELTVTGHPVFTGSWNYMVSFGKLGGAGHRPSVPPLTRWLLTIIHGKLGYPNTRFKLWLLRISPVHLHDDSISSGNVFLMAFVVIDAQIPTGVDIIADVLDGFYTFGWIVSATTLILLLSFRTVWSKSMSHIPVF